MKINERKLLIAILLMLFIGIEGMAQVKTWTLRECIDYALDKNIQIQKANLANNQNELNFNQSKSNRMPSVNASISENFNWYKGFDSSTGKYGSSNGSNSTNYGINTNVSIFSGNKLNTKIKQSELNFLSGTYYAESVKESIGLNILNAYLQVLYSYENVKNAEKQIEATAEQLALAQERMDLGVISLSDYLQIKSQLANEKSTLVNANSQLALNKVTLEQIMELPVEPDFEITYPNFDNLLLEFIQPSAAEIFAQALEIKPEIKYSELSKESIALNVKISEADFMPNLSLNAGISSGYSSLITGSDFGTQFTDKINPSIGLTLSIPIFQKKQVKTNVALAHIAVSNAELDVLDTKNQLRKEIEQVCLDVVSAQSQYSASIELMQSTQESYNVTIEKYKVGLLNAVDFLVQKTSLINSESNLLQSKYNLIFKYKVLDFYKGIPLTL